MSDTVIRVENLGKLYRIGLKDKAPKTLRRKVTGLVGAPFKYLRSVLREPAPEEVIWALKDVSFEVKQGEVVGIIGRNGAGKSTLLKLLSQITEPSCGYAEIRGRVGSLLEVGTGFHPDLTGRENTYLNGTIMGMKKREINRRFDEIVAFAEVEKFIDTPVKYYSSGMYTRLAFAVAAHLEPEILIMDEVLAVGDAQFQKKCLGKMGDVATNEGRTVLFVSHNLIAIRSLCQNAIVLESGNIAMKGKVEKVYESQIFQSKGSVWMSPSSKYQDSLVITQINSILSGEQPNLWLKIEILLESKYRHKPAFIAVDILDASGAALMQAIPKLEGFLEDKKQHHLVTVCIHLPPLIPGQYLATVWAGCHNTETLDEVKEAVMFEVSTSPTVGRTFPHSNHGYIVPNSTVEYTSSVLQSPTLNSN